MKIDGDVASTSLFQAVMRSQYKLVKILVDGGAGVNGVDKRGDTVLMRALAEIWTSHEDPFSAKYKIVRYLLDNGADPSKESKQGQAAVHMPQMKQFLRESEHPVRNLIVTPPLLTGQCSSSDTTKDTNDGGYRFRRRSSVMALVSLVRSFSVDREKHHARKQDIHSDFTAL